MVSNVHLISGLPRSGSTLLCALLKQNPLFTASMTSPVVTLCDAIHPKMNDNEFSVFFDDLRQKAMLRGVFDAYYADEAPHKIIFDTNRSWTGKMSLLNSMYPESRVICCVRDIGWIIDSIERMHNKNPLKLSQIFKFRAGDSVYSRVETLMNLDNGLIGSAWSRLREAWYGELAHRLIVIPYDTLAQDPSGTMQRLYVELGEKSFNHDVKNVAYDAPEFDVRIGMPGLHKVRDKVEFQAREACIPPDIFAKYAPSQFWSAPKLNTKKVIIL